MAGVIGQHAAITVLVISESLLLGLEFLLVCHQLCLALCVDVMTNCRTHVPVPIPCGGLQTADRRLAAHKWRVL